MVFLPATSRRVADAFVVRPEFLFEPVETSLHQWPQHRPSPESTRIDHQLDERIQTLKMPSATFPDYQIETADWLHHERDLRGLRNAIFIRELGGTLGGTLGESLAGTLGKSLGRPEEHEWESSDSEGYHLLARGGEPPEPIGSVRWQHTGEIAHLGVLPAWRRRGLGSALLAAAVRGLRDTEQTTAWLHAHPDNLAFFRQRGFVEEAQASQSSGGSILQPMRLENPEALIPGDLASRILGQTQGRLFLTQTQHISLAAQQLAAQARRRIDLLSADLHPAIYNQEPFVDAARYLALEVRGRLPVRLLVIDPETAIRRGHRLIELARVLSSDVQIRAVPEDWADRCDHFLLCDQEGYCLNRHQDPGRTLVDFNSSPVTRRLRRLFDQIWQQSDIHPGLGRLHL